MPQEIAFSKEGVAPGEMASNAMEKYRLNFVEDNSLMALVWIPINTLNFRYVPLHFRQPFMSVCGFVWAAALSFLTGMRKEGHDTLHAPDVDVRRRQLQPAAMSPRE